MKKNPLIVGNWKMNYTVAESLSFVAAFLHEMKAFGDTEVIIAAPFTTLYSLGVALSETTLKIAGQNLFWEESGAYTGEVSGVFLKDVGCSYVIIGHSERRQFFGETNQTVHKKIQAALKADLLPLICVGERLEERERGETLHVIERQLKEAIVDIPLSKIATGAIAYEPVWAIGTGKNATPGQAQEVHAMIRDWFARKGDTRTAESLRLLYGGSVKSTNSRDLLAQKDIDGALVGGASLDAKQFADIIRSLP